MNGVGGKHGWRWIFILEGLATIAAGILSFWIIQDFPDTAKFLTDAERTIVIRRLQSDDQYSAGGEKFKMTNVRQSLSDWKTYLTSERCSPIRRSRLIVIPPSDDVRRKCCPSVRIRIVPSHHHQQGTGRCHDSSVQTGPHLMIAWIPRYSCELAHRPRIRRGLCRDLCRWVLW